MIKSIKHLFINIFNKVDDIIDRHYFTSESYNFRNLGIYRILYSVFYLWHLSFYKAQSLGAAPEINQYDIVFFKWINTNLFSSYNEIIESTLVTLLILLLFGYRVRLITGLILLFGTVFRIKMV